MVSQLPSHLCPLPTTHTHIHTHTQNTCSFFGQILVLDNFPVDGRGRCAPPPKCPPKKINFLELPVF